MVPPQGRVLPQPPCGDFQGLPSRPLTFLDHFCSIEIQDFRLFRRKDRSPQPVKKPALQFLLKGLYMVADCGLGEREFLGGL